MSRLPNAPSGADARLALPAAIAWALLVVALPWGARGQGALAFVCLLLAGAAWWLRRTGGRTTAFAACAIASALLLGAASLQAGAREAGGLAELADQRAAVTVEGRLAKDPLVLRAGAERDADRVLTRLDVDVVDGRGARTRLAAPVQVYAPSDWAGERWHSRLRVHGRLRPAEPGSDAVAVLVVRGPPEHLAGPGPIADAAEYVRVRFRQAADGLPADARGLVPGLVIGDTSLTPTDLTDDLRTTGLTHLSAVSGSNVAIVLSSALALARFLGFRRLLRPAFSALLLVAFVILCRPEPSVVRAAVMGGVGLVGLHRCRRAAGLPALAGTVLLVLVADPWLARSYGFALSVLATAGLLLFARPWADALVAAVPRCPRLLAEAVTIPVAAQLVCAPVIVLLSGSVSLVSVLANLLAAPFVAPATVLGVLGAVVAALHVQTAALVLALAGVPGAAIGWVARRCAVLPFAVLPWPAGTLGAALLVGLTVLALVSGPWLVARVRARPLLGVLVGALALGAAVPTPRPGTDQWSAVVCDVGQGDAILLRTGPDRAVLVDTGPAKAGVTGCLGRHGVRMLDAVILTHFHDDHVGGLHDVLAAVPVAELFVSPVADPPAEADRVSEEADVRGLPRQALVAGDVLTWGAVHADVLGPESVRLGAGSVPNNNSVVLDVRLAGARVLLLADSEREEAVRVRHRLAGRAGVDLVKVAHHGSSNTDPDLLRQVGARAYAISVGADNDFGHPAPGLLNALAGTGAPVYRTDRGGDIVLVTTPKGPAVLRGG